MADPLRLRSFEILALYNSIVWVPWPETDVALMESDAPWTI